MENSGSTSEMAEESMEVNISVNAYGSYVAQREETSAGGSIEDRVSCNCKGQCARKKGKGACKCREGNLPCHDLCACDKGKCKNKESVVRTVSTGSPAAADGELRFEQEVEHAQNEIKEFVATLDPVKKNNLLIHLLSMGRGSLDFAKKLAEEGPEDPDPPAEDIPEWCKCRQCVPMDTEEENVCC